MFLKISKDVELRIWSGIELHRKGHTNERERLDLEDASCFLKKKKTSIVVTVEKKMIIMKTTIIDLKL